MLAILLIGLSAVLLALGNRPLAGHRSFATISGKGGRARRFTLGRARGPLTALALLICLVTIILPILLLIAASLAPMASSLFSGWTLHFWIGEADPAFARGQAGIFNNPQLLRALTLTVGIGAVVAFLVNVIGILVAVALSQARRCRHDQRHSRAERTEGTGEAQEQRAGIDDHPLRHHHGLQHRQRRACAEDQPEQGIADHGPADHALDAAIDQSDQRDEGHAVQKVKKDEHGRPLRDLSRRRTTLFWKRVATFHGQRRRIRRLRPIEICGFRPAPERRFFF